MPSSLVQRICIRQNAFWLRLRQALAFGRRLIRLSRLRQTSLFPHVFFIQTRQGRANLAPPSIFICRSGDSCFGGSMATGGGLSSTCGSAGCEGCTAAARSSFGVSNLGTSGFAARSEEHTSELQSQSNLVCRLLL